MTFMELAAARRSVRKYDSRPVEEEKTALCIEAARLAPSASNGQPWRFVLVDEPALRESVAKACFGPGLNFNRFVTQAPLLLVLVIEASTALNQVGELIKRRKYPLIDIGIAAEHLCLQAAELGLGSCMLGWFDEGKIKKLLGIPKSKRLGLVISLGYPLAGDAPHPKIRKPVEDILGRNRYA